MALTYSCVVPTKDRPQAVKETLRDLLAQTRPPRRVVIVDASPAPCAPAADLAVEVLVLASRPSTSAQRNAGARRVDTPLVLFLDDDVRLPADYAEVLLARWEAAGLDAFGGMSGVPAVTTRSGRIGRAVRRAGMLHYEDPRGLGMTLRRSGKVRYVPSPPAPVQVPVLGAGATMYRTDLVLAHPFDERFPGYAPGEDLEMASRVARSAPLLQTPEVRWHHLWDPRERVSPTRWYVRGRCETYFRLRRVDRSLPTLAAVGVSLVAETGFALAESLREREAAHVRGYVAGVLEALRD